MGTELLGTGTLRTMASFGLNLSLLSGQVYNIPNGEYLVQPGPYTFLQYYDPVIQQWRNFSGPFNQPVNIAAGDGVNYRLFNATGTVVGGVVTNGGTANTAKNGVWPAGSSSVTGVVATTTAGAAAPGGAPLFNCLVGGAISTAVTVTAGGANYTKPPIVVFGQPAPGGLQATGYAVLTAGVVTSIVVTNQGACYPKGVLPTVTLITAPGDSGAGATATAALDATNDGKLVAVTMNDFGSGHVTVPTITIAGLAGSPAVTAIMCFTVVTATTPTSTQGANGVQIRYVAGKTAGSNTTTNPLYTTGMYNIRDGYQTLTTSAGATGGAIVDGGLSQTDHSNACVMAFSSTGTVQGATTYASGAPGGVVDTSILIPI
jgi:hypothetical protein